MVRLRQVQLARWDDFQTAEWVNLIENPDDLINQSQEFLAS